MAAYATPELFLAGGALVFSGGTLYYLGSKITNLEETILQIKTHSSTMVSKISNHDDSIKIFTSKATGIEEQINDIKQNVEEIVTELRSIGNYIRDDRLYKKELEKRMNTICSTLGLESHHTTQSVQTKSYEESKGRRVKRQKKRYSLEEEKNVTSSLEEMKNPVSRTSSLDVSKTASKTASKDVSLEENVLNEMASLDL